ncbi:MAG: cytochrome c [Saprospiraceae bacterium]|nr:cytochrome c [Saprospiraceae bacterium]
MRNAVTLIILSIFLVGSVASWDNVHNKSWDDQLGVASVLRELGDSVVLSKLPDFTVKGASAEKGKSIIELGFAEKPGGGKSGKQSSHFVCTSCHNTSQEDPDLTVNDPLARLKYTADKGMPFLQATTLYGAVNRETYYNGDYYLKYGELVEPARNDIRGAIQLCATECAQGRALNDWEMESILLYLWDIDLKLGDLNLNEEEKEMVVDHLNNSKDHHEAINLLKSRYLLKSDATFVYPPEDRKQGYNHEGNVENGKMIYENSCLHCHYKQKYSFFHLDSRKLSFKHLRAKAGSYSRQSIYQVIRWGVPTKSGKSSYMPQYTNEKLTDAMVEDLRAYIEQQAQ